MFCAVARVGPAMKHDLVIESNAKLDVYRDADREVLRPS